MSKVAAKLARNKSLYKWPRRSLLHVVSFFKKFYGLVKRYVDVLFVVIRRLYFQVSSGLGGGRFSQKTTRYCRFSSLQDGERVAGCHQERM